MRQLKVAGHIMEGSRDPRPVDIIIDTGAMSNLMSARVAMKSGLKLKKAPNIQLVLASGEEAEPAGLVDFSLALGEIVVRTRALVMDNPSYELIIGSDFLRATEAEVSFPRLVLELTWDLSLIHI